MLPERLGGIIPPVVSPLLDYERLDNAGLERVLTRLLDAGVHGLFILGTTGEGPHLSHRLRREIVLQTSQMARGTCPVLVGISDPSPEEMLEIAHYADHAGADGLVIAPPFYAPICQEELLDYCLWMVPQLPLPVFLYNMPSHCKITIEVDTVKQLAEVKQIRGVKDSSGDMDYFQNLVSANTRPDFCLLTGPEMHLAESLALGGHGGVCGGANLYPQLFVDLYAAHKQGRSQEELEALQLAVEVLGREVYFEGFLTGVKTAMQLKQICSAFTVPPLRPMSQTGLKRLRSGLHYLEKIYPAWFR